MKDKNKEATENADTSQKEHHEPSGVMTVAGGVYGMIKGAELGATLGRAMAGIAENSGNSIASTVANPVTTLAMTYAGSQLGKEVGKAAGNRVDAAIEEGPAEALALAWCALAGKVAAGKAREMSHQAMGETIKKMGGGSGTQDAVSEVAACVAGLLVTKALNTGYTNIVVPYFEAKREQEEIREEYRQIATQSSEALHADPVEVDELNESFVLLPSNKPNR